MKPTFAFSGSLAVVLALNLPAIAAANLDDPLLAAMQQAVARTVVADAARIFGPDSPQFCLANRALAACLHPDTPPERVDELLRRLPTWDDGGRYQLFQRWSTTALDGPTGGNGNPINLTYGFLPDGVSIPGGVDEPASPNRIHAVMNLHFGDESIWKPLFAAMFADWGDHIGITYQEVDDDGAAFPGSPGVLGLRGDVRIGSHAIDGAQGILAYNYFPNVGDMVLDSAENWGAATNGFRYMRNIVRHEHGHGFGLQHVTPNNCTKLMEAFVCTGYDGPQDDDIRGGMRFYGDTYERNNTVGTATDLGPLDGISVLEHPASLTSSVDSDYYRFTTTGPAELGVILDPVGARYLLEGVFVQTDEMMDLALRVLGGDGSVVLAEVSEAGLGDDEVLTALVLPEAGDYWLHVFRAGGGTDIQRYGLTIDVAFSDLTAAPVQPATPLAATLAPNPFNPRTVVRFHAATPGPFALDIYDVTGKHVRHLRGDATSGWNEQPWDGRDDRRGPLPSGTYLLRLRAGDELQVMRGVLLE